jgi:hypothetical protein
MLVATGCGDALTDPTSAPADLAFAIDVAGGPAEAFDRADRLLVRIVADGRTVVLDTVITIEPGGEDVRLRVRVPAEARAERGDVEVEVRLGEQPLFRGEAAGVALSGEEGPVSITLQPVVAGIVPPATAPTITTLGGTVRVSVAAILATGDTVPGVSITWTALDPGVVTVTSDGTVRAVAEGSGRVQASFGNVTGIVTVRVQATVARVEIVPDDVTLPIGATQVFTVIVRDGGGSVLQRVPVLTSTNTNVVSILPDGTAQANAVGTATIRATVEGVIGEAQVTVIQATPTAATGVGASSSLATITLNWTDNAGNETRYEIRRGPSGGPRAVVQTLPADAVTYMETLTPDQVLDYSVAACNAAGCTDSDVVTARTVPNAPTRLMVDDGGGYTGVVQMSWLDNSASETRFDVELADYFDLAWTLWEEAPAGTGTTASHASTINDGYYYMRVRACNEAGCSAPSNEELVMYFSEGPARGAKPMPRDARGVDRNGSVRR